MTKINRTNLLIAIEKLGKFKEMIPLPSSPYKVQLLPGESIEEARRRVGAKVHHRRSVVYLAPKLLDYKGRPTP